MRLAVLSPFVDRQHGTERVLAEQLERLSTLPDLEIHLYAQRVQDLQGIVRYQPARREKSAGRIFWHKVPFLGGPHVLGYIWWFLSNHICRWFDARFRDLRYDLVYSPGVNAWDADAIAIHIVFHEFYRRVGSNLSFSGSGIWEWPKRLHRRLYYRMIMALEKRVYSNPRTSLAAVSSLVSEHLRRFFHRDDVRVILNSVDTGRFTPETRLRLRCAARREMGLQDDAFALLLVGNDWKKKGLDTLLQAVAQCRDLPFTALIAGADDRRPFDRTIEQLKIKDSVRFIGSRSDVEQYYAAADVYAGPSLEDSFALPPIEAMACGLPVITSVNNGGAEIITEGVDGFVLADPKDALALAQLLRNIYEQPNLRDQISRNAARTARAYSWDHNARETWEFLSYALQKKTGRAPVGSNKDLDPGQTP